MYEDDKSFVRQIKENGRILDGCLDGCLTGHAIRIATL